MVGIKNIISGIHPKQENYSKKLTQAQLEFSRHQRTLQQTGGRAAILIEGMDCAGKGGVIKRLTEKLDPRGFDIHLVGPPDELEKNEHYMQRFWRGIPKRGKVSIFDRSWYGRVLVEKVEGLTDQKRIEQAYEEIHHFEKSLVNDGIVLLKFMLLITKDEQKNRLQARIDDPTKLWKIGPADIRARAQWDKYIDALDEVLQRTNQVPWHVVPANDKHYARVFCLEKVIEQLNTPESEIRAHRRHHVLSLLESIQRHDQGEFDTAALKKHN